MPFNDDTFLELKDCIFIKGLPTNANVKISDVREYFEQRIGECCVEMTALSKDKRWFFVAIKFKSPSVAEKVMERYDDNYICGHRVTMSYWRVPRSMTHSGQLLPNSYWGHKPNTRQWEHRENCDDKDDVCVRRKEEYSRERLSWDTKHAQRDPACHNERDNYCEESDNFRDYQDNNGRYKTSDNYSYEEQAEDYLPQCWDSGGLEEGYYDDNRSGWDSDYNGSSENFSEREQYDKEEELPYHHEEHIWQESDVIQDNDQNFIDQTERWDYDRRYPELDRNREIYSEPYEGSLREEHGNGEYRGYQERPSEGSLREEHGNGEYRGYQERPSEETSYRTENLCERNRDWYGGREHSRTQHIHTQRQENSQNSFSQFDHTNHWPKWEVVAPNNPTRRRLSDPDILQEAHRHNAWEQDFADQRSCNKSRDLTGRNPGDFVEERPRSDEWLTSSRRHFQSRGRHSTSPVNLRSKDDSHQGFARSEEIRKSSSHEPFDSRTSVDRKHGGDFVHSMHRHCSNSPVRGRRSSPNTSKRSSSSERSSDFKLHETSPRSEKSSHSCNEHSSGTRERDSRSYSPKGRHSNNRVPYDRGNAERSGTRRDCDLRRSLMLHQQRKHLSSLPRDRSREEGSKRSSLERGRKSSPDEHYRSSGSISSTDSSSPPKGGNRKRQHEDEKIRQDMETAKKRKQTSHRSLTHSDTASRDDENTRNKAAKSSSESRKQPPVEQKKSTREPRDQVSSDKSNTGRANRLLSDLAATLAEDNISLKRPSPDTDVAQRKVESTGGHAVKSQGYTTRSKEYHKKCHPEEDEEVKQAVSDDNLQLVDSNGDDSCAKGTVSELLKASEGEITTHMSRTTPLAAPSIGSNSDEDMKEVMELYNRAKLPAENSHNAEKSASSPNDTFQPLKLSPKHTMIWSNSDRDANEPTRFYEGDSAQLPEENSQRTEKSAPFPKDKFQPLKPAPEQPMLLDNSDQEVNEATGFHKDIRTTLPRNIALSPKGKLRSLKPSPEPLEFAEIKTNSTYIVDDFEKARELVDKTVVSSNRKAFEPLNPCLQHLDFAEIKTNDTFIVDDFENAYRLDTIENGVSFKKTSAVELIGQGRVGNSQTENCHVVDMEVSSDDQASPNVIQARNEFCYPADTRNAGKGSVNNTGEDPCISKEASGDLITTEQKTFEVEEFSLSGTGSGLHLTKPSMSSTDVSQVGIDTLKQGAYNTKHKASKVENTGTNNNGSCLLYTEPSIYTVQINDDRADTLTQGSNNIKDCNGVNSRKRTTCAVKKQDLNAIYTEQELSNCNSDELIKESRDFDSNPQDVSDKNHASNDVSNQKKIVDELNETLSDANCQDKMILKIDKEGHAKVTQDICHDSKVGHIYSTVTEECNVEDAITNSTEQKFSAVEGINNVQKRGDDKKQDTGIEINGSSVFSDKHQRRNNDKEKDENETNSNIEWSSWKCIKSVATRRDQKSHDEKSIDVIPNKKGTSDAHSIETSAGKTRIGALNTERGVCGIESSDSTSCLSNAIQEGYNEKNVDCDIAIAKKQNCDNGEPKIYNNVTQRKRHFLKDVYTSSNARQESNSYVTQKKMHLSKELIPGRVMQELSQTNVNYVGLKAQKMFHTDCPRFSVSIPEQAGDYSKISKVDPGIVKRRSSWPRVDPYKSNAADTNKSTTSSINTCKAVHGLQKTKDLVPESFEHLDMEISSDEEHQLRLTDSTVRVVDGDSARKNDASKPYSPSSPTRKSDEHCSPHAKEECSPYSPSHPTNVSEGDLEQNDPVKELCFDDKDDGASTCEAREEIITGGFALKNSFKGIEDGRKKRNANTTVFKQAINSDGIGVTSVNSFTLSSSPKSKSGPSLRVSLAEGSVDVSVPVDDATPCGGEKANSECNKSDGKGGAASVVNLTANGNGEDMKKPSMRCPKRTQSLPTFSSVVPRPKVMYITATKTKHVKTDSGSLHKSRILYATNDRIAKPVNSLSLDEISSKDWIFGEGSSHNSKDIKGPIVFETRQGDERKTVHDVKSVLTKRSDNSDAPLKLENIATQLSDLDMGTVSTPSRNAKTNNVLKVSAIEGCGSFTGSMATLDKEKVDISNTSITEQDREEECSRAILKDKDTASGAAHFVQDMLCKDTVAHDEAGNLMTTIKGTETADVKVLPTSYSITSGGFDKSVDKEKNCSSKSCSGTPSSSNDDISSFGSVPEGEQTLVSKELKERTSLRSHSTSFHVEGSMTEVPSNCNHKVRKGIKRDTNCRSVDTPVTSEMIDKRPITCEMTKYGHDNNQTLLLGTNGHVESTVLEGEVENRKDEIDKESSSNVPEQRVRTVQTLPTSSSRSGKKRSHPDQRKGSRPCKVPSKSLKLIIPSHQVFNGGANRAAKPGVNARKTSSCTVTRADLHFAPGNNGDLTSKLDTGAKEDMFASFNPSGNEKPRGKNMKKPVSCTITSANLDFVPGNNSLPINETDMLAVDGCGFMNSELSSPSNRIAEIESGSRSQGWQSTTGNVSPLSRHLALHNQHNETSHSSVGNIRIEEHREKGVLTESKASFAGKESDWSAFKMERLRKKKEEIEQVYKRECQTVINVVKMLVSNDPRLEGVLQNAVRRSLQEMGQRCVQELEKEARPAT